MTVTVVTTSPGFGLAGDLPDRLKKTGWRLIRCARGDVGPPLSDADFLVAGLPAVGPVILDAAPRLRAVLKHGIGLDSIDVDACSARGVAVTNTPGANSVAVAELALAHILALSRNLVIGHASVVSGGWDRRIGREVQGATLGIVGFGAIGRTLAAKARALGMNVLATDPVADTKLAESMGVRLLALPELLKDSDHVSLHVFGGPSTAGLIGRAELALMKVDATILNLSRGGVLDLDALADALAQGRLSGAALDAHSVEPPDRNHPIFADPRVIFSPHSGGDTTGALIRMGHMVIDDIETLLAGQLPRRTVNSAALKVLP